MKWINIGTLLLVVVGGLYLGTTALVGGGGDLLANVPAARLVFAAIGASAVWQLIPLFRSWRLGEIDAEAHPSHGHAAH
ncbi:MAG: hypothetical protein JWQ97_93 [Phenylobacterium sp.]|jgi:uncharacterized membrane protein YuzA (DUF378 family)|nr:hypothetical protein [Phenylobacterium sp.]